MHNLSKKIKDFAGDYLADKSNYPTASKQVPSWSKLVDIIPSQLISLLQLPSMYLAKGSIGKGRITDIPWVCLFDKSVTTSAQHGFYIVILFKSDMTGFYISLNQGWVQYEKNYGSKLGKKRIVENTKIAQSSLRTIQNFDQTNLVLGANRDLGEGYELGNIASKFFPFTQELNDKEIYQCFIKLIAAYGELKGIVGNNILNIKSLISEENYQLALQATPSEPIAPGPIKKQSYTTTTSQWFRDPKISKSALEKADFKCELNDSHNTFISNASGKPFMEAHHLIPMESQDQFEYSIDIPENIICLCPNCHRFLHHSKQIDKRIHLEKLLKERISSLMNRGIEIDFSRILKLYE